jgi:tRNA(Ile)-lysidine synthase
VNGTAQLFSSGWLTRRLKDLLPDFPPPSIAVALSGGVDSTALLVALAERKSLHGRLRAIHVNHGLHPNAKQWVAMCRELTHRLAVPLTVLTAKVSRARGTSLEAEARKARYELLAQELNEGDVLLTAHHEEDQLETVLLQLLRGAGVAGLAAMPEVVPCGAGRLVRPLLQVQRASLEAFVSAHELSWVEDDTNADERFDRNYLRRQVLPLLKARWPGAARAVSRSARHAAEAQRLLNALALSDVERSAVGAALSVKALRALSLDRRRNAVRFWIASQGAQVPNTARLEEICGPVLDARIDAHPHVVWAGTMVERRHDLLSLGLTLSATKK